MGAPSSGLIAEFFLQNLEDTHLVQLFGKHEITAYFCYVTDILIIMIPATLTLKTYKMTSVCSTQT